MFCLSFFTPVCSWLPSEFLSFSFLQLWIVFFDQSAAGSSCAQITPMNYLAILSINIFFTVFETSLQLALVLRISYLFLVAFMDYSILWPVCSWIMCWNHTDESLGYLHWHFLHQSAAGSSAQSHCWIIRINISFAILRASLQLALLLGIFHLFLLALRNSILWPVCSWNQYLLINQSNWINYCYKM